MRKLLLFLLIVLLGIPSLIQAQQPSWIDYQKRMSLYPESTWITGFVSGFNTNDEDPGKLVDTYESMARDKVVQSIEVEIETQNSLAISNVNGHSNEDFLSKSVSFSHAKINGLRTEHFYDKKKKQVYAFSYVNKKELAFYYKNLMAANQKKLEQKLTEGRAALNKGFMESALTNFYEGLPLLAEIDQAHMLLVALNRKMLAEIHLDEINQMRAELNEEINKLQKGSKLNMEEAAYFVAYGLFVQLGQLSQPVLVTQTTYANTGFAGQFSSRWTDALKAALVKAGNYQVSTLNGKTIGKLFITGNYWIQDGEVKIQQQANREGEVVAVSTGRIPMSWLQSQHISPIPDEMSRIEKLNNFKLKALNPEATIKSGTTSDIPLEVGVSYEGSTSHSNAVNVPVVYINKASGRPLCRALSNESGVAAGYLPELDNDNPLLEVEAMIDVAAYVPMDTLTAYYTLVKRQLTVLPAHFLVHVQKQVYCIESTELLMGSPMEINTIEPTIKQALVDKGYQFTDNPAEADFLIKIAASATTGTSHQGIFFTYVDANLSIVNQVDNKEIYKTHVDQVKGGGANYVKAGKKAYVNAAGLLKEAVLNRE